MKPYLTKIILTSLTLTSSLFAQATSEDIPAPQTQGQSNKIASNALELTKETLKPLNDSAKLQRMLKMVEKSKLHNQDNLEKILSGKIKPWQDLIDNKAQMEHEVAELANTYQAFLSTSDPAVIKSTAHELRRALNLIGPYLQNADYLKVDQTITQEEADFLEKMDTINKGPAPLPADLTKEADVLKLAGPSSYYTLLKLPCPIDLKAKPGSTVYLTTGTGGHFSNGLSTQAITADENGDVSTHWVSPGDSIALGTILITSPQAINQFTIDVNVVKPLLVKIPEINIADLKQLGEQINQLPDVLPNAFPSTRSK